MGTNCKFCHKEITEEQRAVMVVEGNIALNPNGTLAGFEHSKKQDTFYHKKCYRKT